MSAIGQLAGGVAHEINNPLTGVLNNVQLIKLELESRKEFKLKDFRQLLDIIEESAQRCARVTRALLDFSRRSRGEFAPLDINEVIESAFVLGSHELKLEGIEIVKKLSPNLPLVLGNSTQLQQVLLNLMSNAKNALKQIEKEKKLAVRTSFLSDKKLVRVEFSDNGCGIPRENLSKIFEPFFTTAEVGKGTGLGLSISYGIIQAHKGNIEVTSEEGKGTTFTISLPVTKGEADISN
jgi:signal transduction histidine kinase